MKFWREIASCALFRIPHSGLLQILFGSVASASVCECVESVQVVFQKADHGQRWRGEALIIIFRDFGLPPLYTEL